MYIGNQGYQQYSAQFSNASPKPSSAQLSDASPSLSSPSSETSQDDRVTLSPEAIEKSGSNVRSFAYGALGMDHPSEVKDPPDDAYAAGQVLSALGTIGAVLAIVV